MIQNIVEECLIKEPNRFDLITRAAKRAHVLQSSYDKSDTVPGEDKMTTVSLKETAGSNDKSRNYITTEVFRNRKKD